MYSALLLLLLASVHCQNLDALIGPIGKPPYGPPIMEGSSTLVPPVKPNASDDLSCIMPDGATMGECVSHYLCNTNNSAIVEEPNFFDIRPCVSCMDTCVSSIDTCCLVADIRPPTDPIILFQESPKSGCGWANPKGAGMRLFAETSGETQFGEFPWMVAVLVAKPLDEKDTQSQKLNEYIGGGSLIHPSAVLTAAHYVSTPKDYRVRAGEWDTQTTKEIYPFQDRKVISTVIHEDFNKKLLIYDVAILFLEKPMDLAANVRVACLPPPRERIPAGTRCYATGWGKDKFGKEGRYQVILKKVKVPVVENSVCQTALRTTRLGRLFKLHSSFMCAGGEKGIDQCRGDGGSPLSCPIPNEQDRYMQSGIVAWGIGCGENGVPGVYVDVANLRDWIDDKMVGKGYDPKTYTY